MGETVKYLEMIQSVINRMGQNSFIVKGWTITLVTGLIILSIRGENRIFLLIALIPGVTFWCLDAYYLRQERLFRELYNRTAIGENPADFLMNANNYKKKVGTLYSTLFSISIWPIHITVLLVISIIAIIYIFDA